ncbi:hypothetical protein CRUP_016093, partial [Coryphaenoides rupestris]
MVEQRHIAAMSYFTPQGSLDNMSIIIVCFPGAPQVSQKALQEEAELEQRIEQKVAEIVGLIRARDEDPDLLHVIKFLTSENIPGLPPGGGVTSKMPVSESDGGAPGYGSIPAAGGAPHTEEDDVESAPLLAPQDPPAGKKERVSSTSSASTAWLPLTKEELQEEEAGDGGGGGGRWKKIRSRLVWLFWLCWLAMLGTAIAIIVQSPRPTAAPLRWWQ